MNNFVPGDPKAIFQAAVDRGLNGGASYLEIYWEDILNPDFQSILSSAQGALRLRGG